MEINCRFFGTNGFHVTFYFSRRHKLFSIYYTIYCEKKITDSFFPRNKISLSIDFFTSSRESFEHNIRLVKKLTLLYNFNWYFFFPVYVYIFYVLVSMFLGTKLY